MLQTTEHGPFARARLQATFLAACDHAGIDPADATLIHATVNATFRTSRPRTIVRIASSASLLPQVERVVALAHWLNEHGVAAVMPTEVKQPLVIDETDHIATFWAYVPPTSPTPTAADLAVPLLELHSLGRPPFNLPFFAPIATARQRLKEHAGPHLTVGQRVWLEEHLSQLEQEFNNLDFALPTSVIHGDAYVGNVLRAPDGRAVLCDLDGMCIGPPEWDLVPELVASERYGRPQEGYDRLVDTYGFDPRTWCGLPVLRSVREVLVLTGVLPVLDSSLGIRREFQRRLASMIEGTDRHTRWTPFASAAAHVEA
jgi:aminoglycoside phosphotransferase (APT) family kinase protein